MQLRETHQMSADLGSLELWCNRCGANVAHDLLVTTDNVVERSIAGTYFDAGRVVAISAECAEGHRQTVL